jgi:hypothetical protein
MCKAKCAWHSVGGVVVKVLMHCPDTLQARDFITENQIFQIKPRHGLLEAGGRGLVTLKYKPQYEGKRSTGNP